MYYRRGLFRLRDWLQKTLVGMGEWFPGCTIMHECLSELFPARENDIFHWYWTFSKHCSLSPGCFPSPRWDLGGLSRSHSFFFAVGMHLETGWLRRIVDEIRLVGASLRINKSESQLETLWAVFYLSLYGWELCILVHSALWGIDCMNLKGFSIRQVTAVIKI